MLRSRLASLTAGAVLASALAVLAAPPAPAEPGGGPGTRHTTAVPDPDTAPSAPTSFTVTPNAAGTSVTVAWHPPADDGGQPVEGYVALRSGGGGFQQLLGADARSHEWLGLVPGSTETFEVRARNAVGYGAAASLTITLPDGSTTPSAPTAFTVTPNAAGTSVTVAWQPPADDGGEPVTGYVVLREGGGGFADNVGADVRDYTWLGLIPGSTETFAVRAVNDVGFGAAASLTITLPVASTTPSAPQDLGFQRTDDSSGILSWTPPRTDGGSAITGYDVQVAEAPVTHYPASTRSAPVSGLVYGQFTRLRVRATNAQGEGEWGLLLATTTLPPGAPTGLAATSSADGTAVTATWAPPESDSGSPVQSYLIRLGGQGRYVRAGDPLTATWTDLEPGTTYDVDVTATNRGGESVPATTRVTTAGPSALPLPPTFVAGNAAEDGRSFTLVWTPPLRSTMTGYRVALDGVTIPGDLPASATDYTWTGLRPGRSYELAVRSVNAAGVSTPAISRVTTARTVPDAPTGLVVTPAADGRSAQVTWAAPAEDGGLPVTGYAVGRTGAASATTGGAPYSWTGLTPGTAYTFAVAATNERGTGAPAQLTVTMPVPAPPVDRTAPGAPGIRTARSGKPGGKATAKVSWSVPTYGGTVTGYRVIGFKLDRNGKPLRTVKSELLAAGKTKATVRMQRGRYRFAVVAIGLTEAGPQSARTVVVRVR